jgi:predicted amidohydrolase YtcJ
VSPTEAIRAYSIDGAYAAWEEDLKGSVEVGKLADLVVLDRDPLEILHDDLRNVQTLMTIVNGVIAYTRES